MFAQLTGWSDRAALFLDVLQQMLASDDFASVKDLLLATAVRMGLATLLFVKIVAVCRGDNAARGTGRRTDLLLSALCLFFAVAMFLCAASAEQSLRTAPTLYTPYFLDAAWLLVGLSILHYCRTVRLPTGHE